LKNHRIYYLLIMIAVIFLGIMSRKTNFIPLYFGDFLYAIMIYLLIRILFIKNKSIQVAVFSLLLCYSIEILQLHQDEWIIAIRKTLFGKYVLGQGFLWTDILAYTFGVVIAFCVEKLFKKNYANQVSG